MKLFVTFISIIVAPMVYAQPKSENHSDEVITRIVFGSCNNPRNKKSKPVFDAMLKKKPDVSILLGDNIYGDTKDMKLLQKKYDELGAIKDFQRLRRRSTLLAVWDDHDYGTNDGGKSYSKKKESQQIFLDFFADPADSPRRKREGIYTSYTFGPKGKTCQILLLDTRYFRDELKVQRERKRTKDFLGWYSPTTDTNMTLLGEAQWKWLEEQLQVPADIRIIASSIQILASEKGMESWGNVPHERKRLFDLLKKHKANHCFAISGDVHFAELSKKTIGGCYPFYDLTSSGISHTHLAWSQAKNSFRVGNSFAEKNFGIIDINWLTKSVVLGVGDAAGKSVMSKTIKLSELTFK